MWAGTAASDCTASGGGALGTCWENAYLSIFQDWGAIIDEANDQIYVRSVHAEAFTTDQTITGEVSEGSGLRPVILSVVGDTTGEAPGNLATGAEARTATFGADITYNESFYIYGFTFETGGDHRVAQSSADSFITLEQCNLIFDAASTGSHYVTVGTTSSNRTNMVELIETDITFDDVAQGFRMQEAHFYWRGGILQTQAVTELIDNSNGFPFVFEVEGVDLSVLTTGHHLIDPAIDENYLLKFTSVEVGSGFDWVNGTIDVPTQRIEAYYTESGTDAAPALQIHFEDMQGEADQDTARTITAGGTSASDGTTDFSWTLDTTTNTKIAFTQPFRGPPVQFFRAGDGNAQTIRFHWANTLALDDDEVWMECLIASNPTETSSLGVWVTTRPDPLTTPTATSLDSTTWGGTDVTIDFFIDVTASPDKDGLWSCYPVLGIDAERVSFNPRPDPQ